MVTGTPVVTVWEYAPFSFKLSLVSLACLKLAELQGDLTAMGHAFMAATEREISRQVAIRHTGR